jgi:hypothetical protein
MHVANFLPLNYVLALPLIIQVAYLLSSFLIGMFGRKKKMGFWGFFFFSIIFSPIMGLLVFVAT